jgi:hypothetical protein
MTNLNEKDICNFGKNGREKDKNGKIAGGDSTCKQCGFW